MKHQAVCIKKHPLLYSGILFLCVCPMALRAALLDLSNAPPYLTSTVQPNVFFTIDDSGSMDWEILNNDHWHACSYDPNIEGALDSDDCGWYITEKLFRSYGKNGFRYFEYIYDNADNQYNVDCNGSDNNVIEACTESADADWRIYSSDINVIFYKPDITYSPWVGNCLSNGTACQDANFNAARSNPSDATAGYTEIRDLDGFSYHIWIDDKGFTGLRPRRGTNVNASLGANDHADLWDSYFKFVFNGANIEVYRVSSAPDATGMNTVNTLVATLNNGSLCYDMLGSQSMVLALDGGNYLSTNAPGCRTIAQAKTNVANWYEYYRRRGLAVKNVIGSTINTFPNFYYGLSALNKHVQLFIEMPAPGADVDAHNESLIEALYAFEWPPQGTPLRRGLERAGKYFAGDLSSHPTSPIYESCQQNFSILLTDTMWNGQAPASVTHDEDNDGYKGTLADVARYFYNQDLSPLPNEVPPNPYDPATHQHMVTFIVAFGAKGALVDTDGDGWPNPALGVSDDWGDPFNSDSAKIDDMWHAAYNSTGIFASASTPEEVLEQLTAVMENIQDRVSSATSVAQNSTTLQTNSKVFQARFNTATWKGELLAYPISLDGVISNTPDWNSGCLLTGGECSLPVLSAANNPGKDPNNRVIITRAWDGSQQGIPFRWPASYSTYTNGGSPSVNLINFLNDAPFSATTATASEITANAAYGSALLDFLRGVRTQEKQNGGGYAFRNRESILGDIVHSNPLYVASPDRIYPAQFEGGTYNNFKNTYQNRAAVIYAGANDGMLHAFDAETGEELLAYVPGSRKLYENLPSLSDEYYIHKYFVNGSPSENDVYVNGNWKSLLAGSLGNGGQSIYALDITDPSTFTEANANNIFLFEFSDKEDADMGYLSGPITIAKVKTSSVTSKWALIFGNGYNNTEADGYASTTGQAALYILLIEEGLDGTWSSSDFIKIPVGPVNTTTPNGLAAPYVVDVDADYVVDYIYAGDLLGNLWKFDIRSDTPANWVNQASALFQTSADQPITAQPIVGPHPTGLSNGVMIYFGTGKYLEDVDNNPTGAVTQSFYAIWDKLDGTTVTKADLLQQTIEGEVSVDIDTDNDGTTDESFEYRYLSQNPINWVAPSQGGDPAQDLGWYIDLVVTGAASNQGERQIFQPILRNNNVIFTTILPSESSCDFGGDSWIMEVNAHDGGLPEKTIFDVNLDGTFNSADYILVSDIDGDGQDDFVPAGGQKSSVGMTPTPAVFTTVGKDKEIKVLSGSSGLDSIAENPGTGPQGRQNWREMW